MCPTGLRALQSHATHQFAYMHDMMERCIAPVRNIEDELLGNRRKGNRKIRIQGNVRNSFDQLN